MLKRLYRVTKDKEFQAIYRRGRFQSTALFSINYLPGKKNVSRVGIVVSKKITKKATERNLIKRRIREVVQEIYPTIKNNYDIVISVKKPVMDANFDTIKTTIKDMFTKTGLI